MSEPPAATARPTGAWRSVGAWQRWFTEQPIVPLVGLLALLVLLLEIVQPGIVGPPWIATTIKFATPLAILAAGQTLVMLTGGIDLSVASVATMSAYIAATQLTEHGDPVAIALGLGAAVVVGLINGIGISLFRVQPLVMTLGMGLVVAGFLTVYQVIAVATAATVPGAVLWLGAGTSFGFVPNCLVLIVPLAALVIVTLRRTGFGRLLYAVGDNPTASRLAGVRVWQVLLADYVISAVLAGIAGLILSALAGAATLGLADAYLLPSVAAVVIGGTSIFGGRGTYSGAIVGSLILTVLVSTLTVIDAPEPVRQILYGAIILVVAAAYTRVTGES